MAEPGSDVALRRFPYPYRAMLAICSDLDETPDRQVYLEIMRFLNTTETTAMGPGVGLEVGNTIYFDMPPDQFAYWTTDDAGRAMIHDLIRSGHIDCLHSFGDHATTREQAGRALDELSRYDCRLEVWVDHAVAPSNFGADIMCGYGDVRGHEVYHADLTCGFGVQYVWRGRVTSVTGQNVPSSLRGIFTARHPAASTKTLAKEAAKRLLARSGHSKYAIHGTNRVRRVDRLRDGRPIQEFLRCNPHWQGPGAGATAPEIADVLTEAFLDRLIEREGVCVLYTHLGKVRDPRAPFDGPTVAVFRRLADRCRKGDILITTTRRLLGHCRALEDLSVHVERCGGEVRVELVTDGGVSGTVGPVGRSDLDGLTFYTGDPNATRVRFNGEMISELCCNGPDRNGRRSVSIPWSPLEFPDL